MSLVASSLQHLNCLPNCMAHSIATHSTHRMKGDDIALKSTQAYARTFRFVCMSICSSERTTGRPNERTNDRQKVERQSRVIIERKKSNVCLCVQILKWNDLTGFYFDFESVDWSIQTIKNCAVLFRAPSAKDPPHFIKWKSENQVSKYIFICYRKERMEFG